VRDLGCFYKRWEQERMAHHLDHAVVNSFLRGLRYPLGHDELVRLARANDMSGDYLAAFRSLPDATFSSQTEVMDELERHGYALS